uniref:Glutaredoxin domain-containing protein n=1 Tax=Leersia perrieri TaxID=77586 RepID=A0A0D9VB25_9ORYZ
MGCAASAFLDDDDDDHHGRRRRIIGVSASQHIVSLTSSTYGILDNIVSSQSQSTTNDDTSCTSIPPPPPPPPPTSTSIPPPSAARPEPETEPAEVINSWELMAGLLDPATPQKAGRKRDTAPAPGVVLYTTTLRGVRATFEACNTVRAALESHGVAFRERDISMDRGFRDELRHRISANDLSLSGGRAPLVPRLFVRGKHVGGAAEVARLEEEGKLAALLEGLPRARPGGWCCDGCGSMRFLPCFDCNGSRKLCFSLPTPAAAAGIEKSKIRRGGAVVMVRCGECNENGLVLCPICS